MRDTAELLQRFKTVLQRNLPNTAPQQRVREIAAGDRLKNSYGRRVTVIAANQKTIEFRRDGYDMNCALGRDKFLREFVGVVD
ncbi:DUF4222 domain-containing protein [Buttiauxella selenatireducens]|uniref:DUF4222 domain-containing protein n=1 Tax=Buttiauxella selenatireducens TaxID=3073902 RepID=A0ABY9SFY1_9ENTR|nr:DUF4222 domain-containing protein [Buttiauxella sp. R73]WMY76412.1 DUF4222 domain-containing protein [Buttiauxella sp. R73]